MSAVQPKNLLQLNPDTIQYVRKLYDLDDSKRLDEAIALFEDWISKQNHFLTKDFPRKYLESSIINNKGSVEKAKSKLDRICTLRSVLPHFFNFTDLKDDFKNSLKCSRLVLLPKLNANHERIFIFQLEGNEYFHKAPYMEYYILMLIYLEYLMIHDYNNGCIIITDYRSISPLEVVPRLSPIELKQLTTIVFDGYAMRLKGIHFLSESSSLINLINIIKPFLPTKIAGRMNVYKSVEGIYEFAPKDILPLEFGGTEGSIFDLQKDWIDLLNSKESMDYLNWVKKAGVQESYRVNNKTYDECLGLAGTFRTLNVD